MFARGMVLVLLSATSLLARDASFGQEADSDVDDVLQKYIQALGGEETLSSVASLKLNASQKVFDEQGNPESTDSMLVSGRRWIIVNSQGVRSGFDGSRYWVQPKGYKARWQSNVRYPYSVRDPVGYPLHLLSFPGTLRFAGRTKIGDATVLRIRAQPADAEPAANVRQTPLEFRFDDKSGLLVQVVFEGRDVDFSDYRDVDGIMIPFQQRLTYRFADISQIHEITVESIELNPKLDSGLFVAPVDDDGQ